MGKRADGEGTVWKNEARSRWEGQIRLDGVRRKVTGKTKAEALGKLAALRKAADADEVVADGNTTLNQLADLWAERVLATRKLAPSTRMRYAWALELVRAELGTKRLRGIGVDDVEKALDRIATGRHGRGNLMSRASMTKVRDVMHQLFDFALRRRMVATNVVAIAELPPTSPGARPRRSLTVEQARTLWNGLDGPIGLLLRLQLATGMRPGEAAAVTWDAIDLDAATLNVRRGLQRDVAGRAVLVDSLKTTASYRTIRLSPALVAELREHRRATAGDVVELHAPRLLFPSSVTGGPLSSNYVAGELARICRRLGLPELRPNELRHCAASLMSDQGARLEDIADVLGQSSTRMLDLHYRHRLRPSVDVAADVLGALFEG